MLLGEGILRDQGVHVDSATVGSVSCRGSGGSGVSGSCAVG